MFKDIKGYEGLYAVNEQGEVWSYRRNKLLKPWSDGKGYLKVGLVVNYNKDMRRVHRLVMETFCPVEGIEELEVNHLDEDKHHNSLENLCWTTHKENINYGTGSVRSGVARGMAVNQYTKYGKFIATYPTMSDAAKAVDGSTSRISLCCRKKACTHKGFKWRFANGE